jgi:DNA-binding MltR family transcriptional regulator
MTENLREVMYPTGESATLSALIRAALTDDDALNVKSKLHLMTDRSLAIITSSWVERALEQAIIPFFPKMDAYTFKKLASSEGPLSSFFAKIHLAFALGLLDKRCRDNLDIIRRIRNAFAHAPKAISFSTPLVAKECQKLVLLNETGDMPFHKFGHACMDAINYLGAQLQSKAGETERP